MTQTLFEPDPTFPETPTGHTFSRGDEGIVVNATEQIGAFDSRAMNEIEGLLYLGYLTDNFTLFGHTFTIRTLRRGEKLAAMQVVQDYQDTLGHGEALETAFVAASILMLDGHPLTVPLGESSADPAVWIRQNFLQVARWYDAVVEGIFEKYRNLVLRQTKVFQEFEGK